MIQVWMLVGMLIAYAAIGVFVLDEIELWLIRRRTKRKAKFTVEVLNELTDMLRSRMEGEARIVEEKALHPPLPLEEA